MSVIIDVKDLSKQYRLGNVGTGTIGHDINRWFHRVIGKSDPYLTVGEENDRTRKSSSEYVWALKDINFQVNQGEVLGIIGRNGAGKSTLLKILSRTTAPTTGHIKIKGKVASLLEVGTGFHPELSGRENIYLNGSIMGMRRAEITSKLDDIISFSGVERYIDTPVKRYSSGMYVRLAFAVAAHLEPDILIVDEVLAVGDAEFQKKCLGKMGDITSKGGRTVLFVSHNMAAIQNLCKNALLLNHGQIVDSGNTTKIISNYLKKSLPDDEIIFQEDGVFDLLKNPTKVYSDKYGMQTLRVYVNNDLSHMPYTGCKIRFEIDFKEEKNTSDLILGIVFRDEEGREIIGFNNKHYSINIFDAPTQKGTIVIEMDKFPIYGEGRYTIDLWLGVPSGNYDIITNAGFVDVLPSNPLMSDIELNPGINQFYFDRVTYTEKK